MYTCYIAKISSDEMWKYKTRIIFTMKISRSMVSSMYTDWQQNSEIELVLPLVWMLLLWNSSLLCNRYSITLNQRDALALTTLLSVLGRYTVSSNPKEPSSLTPAPPSSVPQATGSINLTLRSSERSFAQGVASIRWENACILTCPFYSGRCSSLIKLRVYHFFKNFCAQFDHKNASS